MLPSTFWRAVRGGNRIIGRVDRMLAAKLCGVLFLVILICIEAGPILNYSANAQISPLNHTSPTVDNSCRQEHFSTDGNPFPLCPGTVAGGVVSGGNCTWWAWEQWHLMGYDLPRNWGNAADWIADAERAGLPLGRIPRVGAIAVFPRGDGVWAFSAVGHLAFVTAVRDNGQTFDVTYQNYGDPTPMYSGTGYNVSLINGPRFQDGALRFIYFPRLMDTHTFTHLSGISSDVQPQVAQANVQLTSGPNGASNQIALGLPTVSSDQEYNADFTGSGLSDLVLYNRAAGTLQVLSLSNTPYLLKKSHLPHATFNDLTTNMLQPQLVSLSDATTPANGWGSSLEIHIGDFTGAGVSQILLYDRVKGTIQFLSLTATLHIKQHVTLTGFGSDWEVYIGNLDGSHSTVFMYNRLLNATPIVSETPTPTPGTTPGVGTGTGTGTGITPTTGTTPTVTPGSTKTPTPDPKPSPSPSPSPSPTPSPTPKPSPSPSPTPSPTPKPSPSPSPSPSPRPKIRHSPTPSPSLSPTLSPSPSPTAKPSPTIVPSPSPTVKPSPTASPSVTATVRVCRTVSVGVNLCLTPTATDRAKGETSLAAMQNPDALNNVNGGSNGSSGSNSDTASIASGGGGGGGGAGSNGTVLDSASGGGGGGNGGLPGGSTLKNNVIVFDVDQNFHIRYERFYKLADNAWEVYVGRFINAQQDGLFLFDRIKGNALLLSFGFNLFVAHKQTQSNLNSNWTVFSGDFSGSGRAQVLLYDPTTGDANIQVLSPALALTATKTYSTFGTNQVLYVGHFGLPTLSVMLYDPQAQQSTFIAFDSTLAIAHQVTVASWNQNYQVLIGSFLDRSRCLLTHTCLTGDDILVLNRQTGQIEQFVFSFGNLYQVYDNRSQPYDRSGAASQPRLITVDASVFSLLNTLSTSIRNEELY